MIQSKELRIGNWLISAKTDEPFQVDAIPNDAEITATPIALSPDILERCGFKKASTSNEYWASWKLRNGFYISEAYHSEPSAGVVKGGFYWGANFLHIETLHHLQNFYYYYTSMNKELQITL